MGNGSGSIVFATGLAPTTAENIELYLRRSHAMREAMVAWAETQSIAALDSSPESGRTAHAILLHILEVPGAYLSSALGGATGFSRVQGQVQRGELPLIEGLRRINAMAAERVRATTPEERSMVREPPTATSAPCARRCAACWSTTGSTWPSSAAAPADRRSSSRRLSPTGIKIGALMARP